MLNTKKIGVAAGVALSLFLSATGLAVAQETNTLVVARPADIFTFDPYNTQDDRSMFTQLTLFERLNIKNVSTRIGDGYIGWEDAAPFDGIIVTAASPHIPPPLVEQLKTGSHMVIPVDNSSGSQELLIITKNADGTFDERRVAAVRFVPLTRQE